MAMKLTGIIESVFGGRFIFRGFATIAYLVKYSKPNYTYQRPLDEKRIDKKKMCCILCVRISLNVCFNIME